MLVGMGSVLSSEDLDGWRHRGGAKAMGISTAGEDSAQSGSVASGRLAGAIRVSTPRGFPRKGGKGAKVGIRTLRMRTGAFPDQSLYRESALDPEVGIWVVDPESGLKKVEWTLNRE